MQLETDFAGNSADQRFVRLVATEGSAAEPLAKQGIADPRTLCRMFISDVAHYLCILHGRFPGLVDRAANHIAEPEARQWLLAATSAFTSERTFLTRLTVAAGPVAAGAADEKCAQAFAAQSRAFEMLGTSDRHGCAAGAAIAFIEDWLAIRRLLDAIAMRVGIDTPENHFPSSADNAALFLTLAAKDKAVERAMFFGLDQLLTQQRCFWRMMSARAEARSNA